MFSFVDVDGFLAKCVRFGTIVLPFGGCFSTHIPIKQFHKPIRFFNQFRSIRIDVDLILDEGKGRGL